MIGESKKYLAKLIGWVEVEQRVDEAQATPLRHGTISAKKLPKTMEMMKLSSPRVVEKRTLVDVAFANEKGSTLKLKAGEGVSLFPIVDDKISVPKGEEEDVFSTGIVACVEEKKIVISIDNAMVYFDHPDSDWVIAKVANSVTYSRMLKVLNEMSKILKKYAPDCTTTKWLGSAELIPLLLTPGRPSPSKFKINVQRPIQYLNINLNKDQQAAVTLALSSQRAAVIHGPPGTGKSHTLVEVIHQLVTMKKKVLVCGPSHTSIDNLLERVPSQIACLRIGSPDKLTNPNLNRHLLATKVKQLHRFEYTHLHDKMKSILKSISSCKSPTARRKLNRSLQKTRSKMYKIEKLTGDQLIPKSQAVFSTLSGCGSHTLDGHKFDVVIIDEATQALEPDCWLAISHADKVIFAGDHHQLPPVVKSNEKGLDATLFKRLLESNPEIVQMLTEQFRMNEDIMHYSSKSLYGGKLFANTSVKHHLLTGIKKVTPTPITTAPLVFINTNKHKFNEAVAGQSKCNPGEILLVIQHLRKLTSAGLAQAKIAIISPYAGQVELLKARLKKDFSQVKVGSVDGFQGSECEAVIISLVRSNPAGTIGFLKDYRRLNVAVTRARRHLAVIGDGDTISKYYLQANNAAPIHHGFLYGLCNYLINFNIKV